jgi:ligand-binding sensor domain-containing protein
VIAEEKTKVDVYGNPEEKNAVWNILQDRSGKFWFATTSGLYMSNYNPGTTFGPGMNFTPLIKPNGINNNTGLGLTKVESLLEDQKGNIWFGGRGSQGLFCFDGKKLTGFRPDGDHWLWPMLQDRSGLLWFSNFGGVYTYDGQSFSLFKKRTEPCSKIISVLAEDQGGYLWFGTDGGGLCRYDKKQDSFIQLTEKDGLINNSVFTILPDKAGQLWIGTRNMGLCMYNGKNFTHFSK